MKRPNYSLIAISAILFFTFSLVSCSGNSETDTQIADAAEKQSSAFLQESDEDVTEDNAETTEEQTQTADSEETQSEDNADSTTSATYKYVALIGVDGAGNFFTQTDTPNFDEIFADGAVNHKVLTSNPTISAQCWGSMLHGVEPDCHRLSNSVVASQRYDTESIFPSVFRVIRENNPDAVLASVCNWDPINYGIIEEGLGVNKDTGDDPTVTEKVCAIVENDKPNFLFVQFDSVDAAGHSSGYGNAGHLKQITTVDGYIGQIYDSYEKAGILDETLFIVTADHGGSGTSHGGWTDTEKYITFAARGKTVVNGEIGEMEVRDIASVVLHAFGYEDPENWTSRVPTGLFNDVTELAERKVYEIQYEYGFRTHETIEAYPEGQDVSSLLGSDRTIAYFPFDGDSTDASGNYETKTTGKLYYSDGYAGQGVTLDDGYITLTGYKPGNDSFSVAFWIKTGGVSSDPSIFSNKDWNSGSNRGIILSLRDNDIKFNLGNGSSRADKEFILPMDYKDGWVYVVFTADRENGTIALSYDFGEFETYDLPGELFDTTFDGIKNLNIGQDGTGSYSAACAAELDEMIFVSGVITDADLASLAEFYGAKS